MAFQYDTGGPAGFGYDAGDYSTGGGVLTAAVAASGSVIHTGTAAVVATIVNGVLTAAVAAAGSVTYTGTAAVVAVVVDGSAPVIVPHVSWDVWEPYVLPYAPGCPDSTMFHHVRQAAIRFLARTFAWQADLPAILGDGASTVFAMPKPSGSEACKLLGVTVYVTGYQPQPVDLVTPEIGAERIREGNLRPCAFTGDLSDLVVWPAQPAASRIVANVALKPAQLAAEIPAVVFDQHANDIATGALASLLSMPKQEWTDMQAAAINSSQFNARMATVARIVGKGAANSARKSAVRWF